MKIRYGWSVSQLSTQCICGAENKVQHVLSCKKDGFITLRHNHIRNVTTELLSQVTKDVKIEPVLQSLTNEVLVTGTQVTMLG